MDLITEIRLTGMPGLEIRDLALYALAFLAVVLGWYLGTRKSASMLNPSWLGKGFWGRYIPSLPSKNEWEEAVISSVQAVIMLAVTGFFVYWGIVWLVRVISIPIVLAIALFENLPGKTSELAALALHDLWMVVEYNPAIVFVLLPIAAFVMTYLASILNMCLHNLRYSFTIGRQGDQANASATLPTDKTHQGPI